ncbi:hypothetical protein A8709_03500 [Paenibacillus pectinilyticus]|uniref:Uncharacterized protein n=1 Tax=Paenibacillus pectinilyticus TaxID=512399 RepID=A0A1C0ZYW7_9BACL|nr:hypothetical protein [Paenibacillus pectinilyticus]OCT13332.1 hypothetical protein A8709_03500 [Paenibacillus pectinilyticus]
MSQRDSNISPKSGHLFTVEILIEETTNGLAMEKLLHLLNVDSVKDYQILKGIGLGQLIELNKKPESLPSIHTSKKPTAPPPAPAPSAVPLAKRVTSSEAASNIVEQLEKFKAGNTLIRLTVIKAQGIKLSLPCRILNFDGSSQNVTVYHVDEKKVYLFKLNEIEDYETFN